MKFLFFANRVPYPPYRGDKLKIFNLARRLSKSHELHLLTFAQSQEDLTYKEELEKVFTKVHFIYLPKWRSAANCLAALWDGTPLQVLYFRSAAMRQKLAEVLAADKFDAIHVQHLRMSPYLAKHKELPRILDMPDAFSLYWERRMKAQKNPFKKIFETIEQKRVLKYERIMHEYNMSLVCSAEDLAYLKEQHSISNINLLPNGVDLDTFKAGGHDYSHNHTLLFTGNMDYAPNVDAVQYFVEEVFPIIKQQHSQVKFIIAGQRPVKKVQDLASDDVQVTGFIKDLAAVYNQASVVVAPLRFGAGTQNKVLEAMAMGVPVVCSNIGFKGLGIESGEGAIMQTDPQQFAQSVIQLLNSQQMREEVGAKGMHVMQSRFGWDSVAKTLEGYLMQIAE
ncbi:MAG: glycosyltransferase [Flavipsychrobacter sp.]|nr:glycosyltransferase [Chitinophagales bacterium]